jgi:hypothetical protein
LRSVGKRSGKVGSKLSAYCGVAGDVISTFRL